MKFIGLFILFAVIAWVSAAPKVAIKYVERCGTTVRTSDDLINFCKDKKCRDKNDDIVTFINKVDKKKTCCCEEYIESEPDADSDESS